MNILVAFVTYEVCQHTFSNSWDQVSLMFSVLIGSKWIIAVDLFGSSFVSSLGLDEHGKEMDVWVFTEEKNVAVRGI